ncbi:MAG: CDP-alcohol phosphatidyltransferase, partial [Paludibacter sp.]
MTLNTKTHKNALKVISSDRERTNILRKYEQNLIAYLVQRIPSWISSDMLTLIGFSGSIIIFVGFVLATYLHSSFLLLGVAGFLISWFGDSLDGRVAYYRKKPRKW